MPQPTVEREGDDLVVTWSHPTDATLVVGVSPDEASGEVVEPEAEGRARIRGADRSVRHYVHFVGEDAPVVAAERLVPLEGALNFRDLGGYAAADGRQVRWGRVFRSDKLSELTDADQRYLAGLGIRLVCDYRSERERQADPSRLPDHIERHHEPIADESASQREPIERILSGEVRHYPVERMAEGYLAMLEMFPTAFGSVIARLADRERHPVVFHCTAGKDRTGLTAALVLATLGVDDADIVDDYTLTTRYRSNRRLGELRPRLEEAGVRVEDVLAFFTAQQPVMERTLVALRERWGSPEAYLTGPAGLQPRVIDDLRAVLLVG